MGVAKLAESDAAELLDFIAGRGKWRHYKGPCFTYANGTADEQKLHEACLELEKAGKIENVNEDPGGEVFAWVLKE